MRPTRFGYVARPGGAVVITHGGARATILRGGRAAAFLAEVEDAGEDARQESMARWTGQYKHGNERQARQHPRNRGR